MNERLRQEAIEGSGVDIGARDGSASYYQCLNIRPDATIQQVDLDPLAAGVARGNIETGINIDDASQDFVILLNVLEHVYHHSAALTECNRMLRGKGKLLGFVPFLVQVHPDPDDFFRYTASALEKLVRSANFSQVRVEPLGYGPLSSTANLVLPLLPLRFLRGLSMAAAIAGDKFLNRIFPSHPAVLGTRFPVGFFFLATK